MALLTLGTLLALGATAAGTFIENQERNAAADRQREAVLRSIQNQNRFSEEKNRALNNTVQNLSGENREQIVQKRADDNFEAIQKTLNHERDPGLTGESGQVGGKFSETFDKAKARAVEKNLSDGIERAKGLGNFLAIGGAGQDEADIVNKGAQDQSTIGLIARDKAGADDIAIQEAGRIRSSGLGAILKGIGTAASLAGTFAGGPGIASAAKGTAAAGTGGITKIGGFAIPSLKIPVFKPFSFPGI